MVLMRRFRGILDANGIVLTLLIASLSVNLYFGVFLSVRRSQVTLPAGVHPQLIAEGAQAPVLNGISPSGATVSLSFEKNPQSTLLYVFSPTCPWCEKNLANVRAIIATRHDLRVVGINIGPRLNAKTAREQPFAEIVMPTAAASRAFGFGGTPSTVLIAPSGKVIKSWTGAYAGRIAEDVSATLAVPLPGLAPEITVGKGS